MRVEDLKDKKYFKKLVVFSKILILSFSFISIPCQCLTINKKGEDSSVTIHKIKQQYKIDSIPNSEIIKDLEYVNEIESIDLLRGGDI